MHDYGFTLIKKGKLRRGSSTVQYLNDYFFQVLFYGICPTYGRKTTECRGIAKEYGTQVQLWGTVAG